MGKVRGFTMLEMIMCIVIIAILAASVRILLPSSNTYYNSTFTEQLKRDIRLTQNLARNMNTSYTITISSSGYTISPAPKIVAATSTVPPGTGMTLSSSPSAITFDSKGKPNSAATISVTSSAGTKTLSLSAETGFIQ